MGKGRLEAFSDGVIAIIITIMILELKLPHGDSFGALKEILPAFMCYILSFVYVGIYWNNHHHMMHAVTSINGITLWANLNLLFWLSLVPFVTNWMGENNFTTVPVALYGIILLMNGISYTILSIILIKHSGKNSLLAQATGNDVKGKLSLAIYAIAIVLAFVNTKISLALYALVAVIWFIPDRRIEKRQ